MLLSNNKSYNNSLIKSFFNIPLISEEFCHSISLIKVIKEYYVEQNFIKIQLLKIYASEFIERNTEKHNGCLCAAVSKISFQECFWLNFYRFIMRLKCCANRMIFGENSNNFSFPIFTYILWRGVVKLNWKDSNIKTSIIYFQRLLINVKGIRESFN